jgi:hypothetical protein
MRLGLQDFWQARRQILDEMMRNFELLRDKEFTLHVCAYHPRAKGTKNKNNE